MSEDPTPSATPSEPPARRSLSPARLLAFSAFSVLLLFLLLEVSLQILAATQGPQHRLPTDGSIEPPDPAAFRVVAVGDSWVYGAESEPEEAFIEVFRREASENLGKPVQVYNLGVSASNSSQALVALANIVEPVQPHLVVALTGANNRLHDRAVQEAARILGQDARMIPGLSALSRLRTVRLARLLYVNLAAPEQIEATAKAISIGLPTAPEPRASQVVQLPWWDLFLARRWDDALLVLRDATPPGDDPAIRGLQRGWEALLLAHAGQLVQAEAAASDALALGGDDAAAHEARAVIADAQGRGLAGLHHRSAAARSKGNPFLRELARGRVLLELEAWEAARSWLLSAVRAAPGNLEALMALARLPGTVRVDEVDDHLFDGPKGVVTQAEFMNWHLASSGLLDRAIQSLGDPDPDEPFDLRFARATARALTGDPAGAAAAMTSLARSALLPHQQDQAWGGALTHGASPDSQPPTIGPFTAIGLMVANDRAGDCPAAVLAAQRALDLGALPRHVEQVAGPCLPRDLSWTLREMVFERPGPLDRHALIGAAERASSVPRPAVGFWDTFRRRAFDDLPADAPPEWRALAHAFADAVDDPLLDEIAGGAAVADPAVAFLAVGYALLREGRSRQGLVHLATAAESDIGEPWARALARGLGAAAVRDWADAQRHLHLAESVGFRQHESLEALFAIPSEFRSRATRDAVDAAPVGELPAGRWVEHYLERKQVDRASLALGWSWPSIGPVATVRRAVAEARVAALTQDRGEAVRLLDGAIDRLHDELPNQRALLCRTLLLRHDLGVQGDETKPPIPRCREDRPPSRISSPLAERWLALLDGPESPAAATTAPETDVLARQLDGMRRLSKTQGARFVALTYPFPSGHHAEVRDAVRSGGEALGYDVLDLYGLFEEAFSPQQWQGMRTPEDHVNATGYEAMGKALVGWAAHADLMPSTPPDPAE